MTTPPPFTPAVRRLLVLAVAVLIMCITAQLACTGPETAVTTSTEAAAPTSSTTTSTTSTTTSTTVADTLPPALLDPDLSCPEWQPILLYVGFPQDQLATADRILWAESRCRNEAVNMNDTGGGSWCAFQIHRPSWEKYLLDLHLITYWEQLIEDPVVCAAVALHIYNRNTSWTPWSTY